MDIEKYTQKSQEALLTAQRLALDYQHQVIEPNHLLLALVQQEGGIVRSIITKVSGGTQAIQQELSSELDQRPKIQGASLEVSLAGQTAEVLVQIVEIQLRHVSTLLAERGCRLVISLEARAYLAEVGYDTDYGARPLKRAIQRELQDPLAVKILSGDFHEGETIHGERGKDKLEFTVQATDQPVAA